MSYMATVTEKILDYLQMQAESTVDLLSMFSLDRGRAMREARRSIVHGPRQFKVDWADLYRERQKFYSLLNQLKRQGLVSKRKQEQNSQWRITAQGTKYLTKLKSKQGSSPKLFRRAYEKKNCADFMIVSFDVPERDRRKRNWLRTQLLALDFEMLQQSVWLGKVQIPEDFINDLRIYEMIPYVHIFSVSKSGSIIRKF